MPAAAAMAPQNSDADGVQMLTPVEKLAGGGGANGVGGAGGRDLESQEESVSEGSIDRIPLRQWIMHGAVMFGREFCYAMETALVTPVLLQIGLPEQYYSLTWFLSPILGLIFTPLIGSASDRCTLRWGRRRPFILALCVGVLLGVALFLNGSLIGLAIGDVPNNQPIGIVMTVLGVVVLDFCADATEGPIRAYLLDVADTEEQDMALNIHAFSAGLGGAVGYALGGLDWTHTFLGRTFKSQEQILFLFASVLFTVSVALHLFSIEEQQFSPQQERLDEEADTESSVKTAPHQPLDMIHEDEPYDYYDCERRSERDLDMDFLDVEIVRSKSDSVLAMADATLDHHDMLFLREIEPSIFQDRVSSYHGSPPRRSSSTGSQEFLRGKFCRLSAFLQQMERDGEEALLNNQLNECKAANGHQVDINGHVDLKASSANASIRRRRHTFYRQSSCTFSYYGRVGSHRYRYRRANAAFLIKPSRSMNDIYELEKRQKQRNGQRIRHQSGNTNSSGDTESEEGEAETTVRLLWMSMLKMPKELFRLCVCHLVTWFSIIAEAVFYTDFMGQVIYEGDPTVRLVFILFIFFLIMCLVCNALFINQECCSVFLQYVQHSPGSSKRGFGIDCAILSCQVYISQILVASALGSVVEAVGSVRVIPMVASGGSFLGFLASCFLVIYPGSHQPEPDGAKSEHTKALTSNGSGVEKPSFLKLNRKGTATTTCKVECESTL
nr:solute carrier family 45 member 4-like [Danio rerio]|eukprot:XP_021323877.1 solute carrier family 45 member 4-like [Danio rerio]